MLKTKVLIAGSSGLIGAALAPFLQNQGFEVARLLRQQQNSHPYWDIKKQILHLHEFTTADVVINLAGENIADKRWTEKYKQQLIASRISSTKLLAEHFSQVSPPKLFINASAIGYYGNRGAEKVDEESAVGNDFVSRLAWQWEQSSQGIKQVGTRLVNLRTGMVVSKNGGALTKMLPAFKLGLGGRIGTGKQIISWIDINDLLKAILFIINTPQLQGAVNLVSPHSVTNKRFSQLLAKQLNRPCLLPLPEFFVKLLFAEMGKELLLSSTDVVPQKLTEAGFKFDYETLQESLSKQLN